MNQNIYGLLVEKRVPLNDLLEAEPRERIRRLQVVIPYLINGISPALVFVGGLKRRIRFARRLVLSWEEGRSYQAIAFALQPQLVESQPVVRRT